MPYAPRGVAAFFMRRLSGVGASEAYCLDPAARSYSLAAGALAVNFSDRLLQGA